jgi:glyoxylase I family protein
MNQPDPSTIFSGIDHPAVAAEDVDALARWYCELLGYREVYRHEKPVWILGAADGTLLEIMPRDDTPRPERTTWTPGWSHLAIRVPDFEAAERYLIEKGVAFTGEEAQAMGGGRVRSFLDPEGNMLQIVERPADGA